MENHTQTNASTLVDMCHTYRVLFEQVRYVFYKTPEVGVVLWSLYVAVLSLGAVGNLLVFTAVLRNPVMRNCPRNFFITNLALSDFLLCTISVPFNMKLVLFLYWDLGETACKMVATAQAVNIFVSTMSIAAVGLDRYLVIIFPTKTFHQRTGMFAGCWLLSVLMACPYFFVTTIDDAFSNLNNTMINEALRACNMSQTYLTCHEENRLWTRMPMSRKAYTIACLIFQYLLPLCALIFVYCRIGSRMTARLRGPARPVCEHRRRSVQNRQRRTNILLVSLVVIFASSWLPLNIYNVLVEWDFLRYNVTQFAFCHICGMMSACANPVLYGVFNDNFRTEFELIFDKLHILACFRSLKRFFSCPKCSNLERAENEFVPTRPSQLFSQESMELAEKRPLFTKIQNGITVAETEAAAEDDIFL